MSHWVQADEVPTYIQELIFTKLEAIHAPNRYTLRGTHGGIYDSKQSADAALQKLTDWVHKVGAEVSILNNGYADFHNTIRRRRKNTYLRRMQLEITDPACRAIDELILRYRGQIDYPPKNRNQWLIYKHLLKESAKV